MQASAADVMEIERGMRQLQELGLETAVLAAMSERARQAAAAGPMMLPNGLVGSAASAAPAQAPAHRMRLGPG
jgi:hypothetical protein